MMRIKKYSETLILILIMLIVGAGIHVLQVNGVLPEENYFGRTAFAQDPLNIATTQLEQIGRITHDYLNGYLSGPVWGTSLPDEVMKEEIEQLHLRYVIVEETLNLLYPKATSINSLLKQFKEGFELAETGFKDDNIELITKAHTIFHQLDYEVFNHSRTDEIYVRD